MYVAELFGATEKIMTRSRSGRRIRYGLYDTGIGDIRRLVAHSCPPEYSVFSFPRLIDWIPFSFGYEMVIA